jgi:hypothetical protein
METAPLKSFAVKARAELMTTVGARIAVVRAENSLARVESADAVRIMEAAIARDGIEQVIDPVAYTWFNRIIALRFMDANGYTASGVVSPEAGRTTGQPEILAEAKAGTFDGSVVSDAAQATITALLNGTRPSSDPQGESYGLLLEAYCRSWHNSMPFMFEQAGDYTELLIPPALLADDSIRDLAVRTLTEEVCSEVEVIGWLYQFYISERKDEVFAGFKRNKKAGAAEIPAATQLFTPHWIVRYLVENSVGRLWLLNNPTSGLAGEMEYYIESVDKETDFLKISTPEELKVIDPAVGSGHMLTYAFDLLYSIYKERGYDPAEIPDLILEHNLYGTEIDPRAGALAAFALTMKAAAKRKLFLKKPVQPNICVLENIRFDPDELDYLWSLTGNSGVARPDADEFWNAFEHADIYGSLIHPQQELADALGRAVASSTSESDLLRGAVLSSALKLLGQSLMLSKRYAVLVANPPYMGSANMGPELAAFSRNAYALGSADLMTCFMERASSLTVRRGMWGMINIPTWLSVKSFEGLRRALLESICIDSLVHLGRGVFGADFGTVAFVFTNSKPSYSTEGVYRRLFDEHVQVRAGSAIERLFLDADSGRFVVRQADLLSIPRSPIAYWMGASERAVFGFARPLGAIAQTGNGLTTGDNDRFLRFWWEVSTKGVDLTRSSSDEGSDHRWARLNKGGANRRWAGNQEYVIDWGTSGERIKSTRPKSTVRNESLYFRDTVSWSDVTSGGASFRYFPNGYVFDASANAFFPNSREATLGILSVTNSMFNRWILERLSPGLHFKIGDVTVLPYLVRQDDGWQGEIDELIRLLQADWDSLETAMEFSSMLLLLPGDASPILALSVESSRDRLERVAHRVAALEQRNDEAIAGAYDLGESYVSTPGLDDLYLSRNPGARGSNGATTIELVRDLVSYAVGCMFGRYSLDEPGLILADQRGTLQDYLLKVPNPTLQPDADNVIPIVDGDWFEDDIVAGFRKFLRASFGDEYFEENLQFVNESLGVKELRDYFVRSFYDDHVKRYKKRPIYWLFRSPKGSFSALVYLHRYTSSTVSTVLTSYLREFIGKLEANLDYQERIAAGMGDASAHDRAVATKEADRIRKVLVELRDYDHDILFPLAGQNIELDLDDGVLVNYQKLGSALKDIGLKKSGSDE